MPSILNKNASANGKGDEKDKEYFYGSFTFSEGNGRKTKLGVEKWGTRYVQSRWNICLVHVLWSTFKCVENREIESLGGNRIPIKLDCVVEISCIAWKGFRPFSSKNNNLKRV